MSFSIYEKTKYFNLTSTNDDQYPFIESKEKFFGRKCFEFQWEKGSNQYLVGFATSRVFIFVRGNNVSPNMTIRTEYNTRKETHYNIEKIEAMKKYMLCIDTIGKNFLMINGTYTRTIKIPSNITTPFSVFASHGTNYGSDFLYEHYTKDFENPIPASFVSVTDRRSYIYPSCKSYTHHHNIKNMMIISLLYCTC